MVNVVKFIIYCYFSSNIKSRGGRSDGLYLNLHEEKVWNKICPRLYLYK